MSVETKLEAGLLKVARSNLRHFIKAATFKCEVDRQAALNCLEVIEDEIAGLVDLVAVLRSAVAASDSLATTATEGVIQGDSLREALQEAIDVFEGMCDDEIGEELLPPLRAALAQSGQGEAQGDVGRLRSALQQIVTSTPAEMAANITYVTYGRECANIARAALASTTSGQGDPVAQEETVDRVSQAIMDFRSPLQSGTQWAIESEDQRDWYRGLAGAAIAAMSGEPFRPTVKEGEDASSKG